VGLPWQIIHRHHNPNMVLIPTHQTVWDSPTLFDEWESCYDFLGKEKHIFSQVNESVIAFWNQTLHILLRQSEATNYWLWEYGVVNTCDNGSV